MSLRAVCIFSATCRMGSWGRRALQPEECSLEDPLHGDRANRRGPLLLSTSKATPVISLNRYNQPISRGAGGASLSFPAELAQQAQ